MKTIVTWEALMYYAKKVGNARKNGNEKEIKEAEKQLREYEKLCLEADEMILPFHHGDLF